jgi:hypothetical protein
VMETPVKEKDMVSGQFVHHCLIIVIVWHKHPESGFLTAEQQDICKTLREDVSRPGPTHAGSDPSETSMLKPEVENPLKLVMTDLLLALAYARFMTDLRSVLNSIYMVFTNISTMTDLWTAFSAFNCSSGSKIHVQ